MVSLTGTFADRKRSWDESRGTIEFDRVVYLIGLGGQGTMLLYSLLWVMSDRAKFVIVEPRNVREKIMDIMCSLKIDRSRIEWRRKRVKESNYTRLLNVHRGDLILDCSIGVDTIAMMKHCNMHGALFVNSAIEDWLPDGWTPPKDPIDECMVTMHRELVDASKSLGPMRTSVLVSMGCNPGNVSLWTKVGLDYLAARFRGDEDFGSYAEMAESLGV